MSFQNYTSQTRDTNRLASIKTIEKWLQLTFTTTSTYPIPDTKVDILASWSIIWYQGYVWDNVLNIIKSSKTLDPLDSKYYTYSTNKKLTKYQLMTLAETQNVITYLPQTYALTRYVKIFWDKIWIITDTNNTPIQETWTWVDVNTTTWTYKAYISNGTTEVTWTWNSLNVLNISMWALQPKSCLEILNSKQATTDWVYDINPTWTWSFKVYCDMTTDSGGWTMVRWLYKQSFPWNDDLAWTEILWINPLWFSFSWSWSIKFNNINFTQYNFMWRDKRAWVKYNKSDLTSGWVWKIWCSESTYRENSYWEKWNLLLCKRTFYSEDPRISIRYSHTNPWYQNDIIYWEKETVTWLPESNIHVTANIDTNLEFSSVVFIR